MTTLLQRSLRSFASTLGGQFATESPGQLLRIIHEYLDMDDFYPPSDFKKLLKPYRRQYIGVINSDKDSVVFVQFLKFPTRKTPTEFADWQKEFEVGFGSFFEENVIRLYVNLTRKTVSRHSQ